MCGPGSAEEELLKEIMLADLALIHDIKLEVLKAQFEYMHAFGWTNNSLSMGGS